jgi:hypothetical protein
MLPSHLHGFLVRFYTHDFPAQLCHLSEELTATAAHVQKSPTLGRL